MFKATILMAETHDYVWTIALPAPPQIGSILSISGYSLREEDYLRLKVEGVEHEYDCEDSTYEMTIHVYHIEGTMPR